MCSSMFRLCVRMYAVCRSHLCIVNVREYEVQDTFPLQFLPCPSGLLFLCPYLCRPSSLANEEVLTAREVRTVQEEPWDDAAAERWRMLREQHLRSRQAGPNFLFDAQRLGQLTKAPPWCPYRGYGFACIPRCGSRTRTTRRVSTAGRIWVSSHKLVTIPYFHFKNQYPLASGCCDFAWCADRQPDIQVDPALTRLIWFRCAPIIVLFWTHNRSQAFLECFEACVWWEITSSYISVPYFL